MLDCLKNIDIKLFLSINNHHCAFCDYLMFWASDRFIWIPFYFFLAFILYKKFAFEVWKIILCAGVLILLSDQLSVFIKDHVMRYRPCHNLFLQTKIILIKGICGGQYGFVSSHAANSFALATFIILITERKIKWFTGLMLSWTFLISYSRIYLGMHYPLDILGGWIVAFLLAWVVFYFYKKILPESNSQVNA